MKDAMINLLITNHELESLIHQSPNKNQQLIKQDVKEAVEQIAAGKTFPIKQAFQLIHTKYE